ncbi:MAG: type II toxin-antitoxin system VapC family toxin [Bryobacteraceae bacterium]
MIVLVDTSVWIEHLRCGVRDLSALLLEQAVLTHPFVTGELACGNLRDRTRILDYLTKLAPAATASHDEVLWMIQERRLWELGIGWIDAHLLASAVLSRCALWTLDRRLRLAAARVGARLY